MNNSMKQPCENGVVFSHTATGTEVIDHNTILFATLKRAGVLINNS